MNQSYQQLCAEFYDLYAPEAGAKEVAFYAKLLKTLPGPYLEAMCGSGRILIPLVKEGIEIDGVDNAPHMLANCQKRCPAPLNLYNQSIENLSLPKKYGCIVIAIGSFQHLTDGAFQALQRVYDNLLPGGSLLIDMIVPWGLIREDIHDEFYSHHVRKVESDHTCQEITVKRSTTVYPEKQLAITNNTYEKTVNGKIIAIEKEQLPFRWYHRYEMQLFLEKAGFTVTNIWSERFEPHLQSTIYQAVKK